MNTRTSWKTDKLVFLILLGLIFLSHFPFIEADPDLNLGIGRGAFTDEGLNTIQVRNWVNHGELSLSECDNLLKTPLLGFPLAVTYTIFGTSHVVSRLHVLILLFLALLLVGLKKENRIWSGIFLLTTLMQYHVFQSSHFSMAEMLSIGSALLSIHFFVNALNPGEFQKPPKLHAFLAGLFISLTYYLKIQFIYMILLPAIVLIIFWFSKNYLIRRRIIHQGMIFAGTVLAFLLIYLFAWYLPNKETYDLMMAHQSGEFSISTKTWEYIRFNLNFYFLKDLMQWFVYAFLLFLAAGIPLAITSNSIHFRLWFWSSLAWFTLELHKLTMVYLPARYQVSLLVSMGLLMSVTAAGLMDLKPFRIKVVAAAISLAAVLTLFTINLSNYVETLEHRTFVIRDTNTVLSLRVGKNDLVLGAWAPSLTWESGSKAIPVWNHFLNYQDPLDRFKPDVIIAETDEQDSEQAWKSQGIDLKEISDSVLTVTIANWEVMIYQIQ